MSADLLFVYGKLRLEAGSEQSRRLAAESRWVGHGWTEGVLLAIADYPGLVAGGGRVLGDLLRLRDPAASWPWLDAFEGNDFRRERAWVYPDDGDCVRAWCYRYVGPRETLEAIPSGNFLAAS